MSFEVKYRIEHYDLGGVEVQIDIEEDAWGSAITDLTAAGDPTNIEWENESDDVFDPIRASRVDIKVIATSAFALADLYSVQDRQFRVKIYNAVDSADIDSDLYWAGYVKAGNCSESYERHPYIVTIGAECGLKDLQNILYFNDVEDSGDPYNGRILESQILMDILNKIGYYSFTEYVNLYEDRMNSSVDDSPMDQLLIDVDIFKDMYCYEVLIHLLTKYNACITQKDGGFIIYRPTELTGVTVYGRVFTDESTYSSTSFTPLQYISRRLTNLSTRIQVPGGVTMIQDPVKKVKISQDYGNKKSWLDTWEFKGEDWDAGFPNWISSGLPVPALLGGFVPGEDAGVMLAGHNTYPALTNYIYQEFAAYSLASAGDQVVFEIDYMFHNTHTAPVTGIIVGIRIEAPSGKHLVNSFLADDPGVLNWRSAEDIKYISLLPGDVLPGDSEWAHYKGIVSTKYGGSEGLPESGIYTIKIHCTDDTSTRVLVYPAFKNVRFYITSYEIVNKFTEIKIMRARTGWIPFGEEPVKLVSRWLHAPIKEFKEITVNEYEVVNAINGNELELNYILGDVDDVNIDNVIEQFAGALAMVVIQSLEQAAGDFVADHAAEYLTGGVIVTFEEDSLGVVDIVFTAETAGVPFTGATSITPLTGNLGGTLPPAKQVANTSAVARVDICEFGPSTGGTGNITCAGLTKLATFATDINVTADNFVAAWAAAYDAVNVVLTNEFNVLFFTAKVPGVDFSPVDVIVFANVTPDLQAAASTDTANNPATVAQVATIQLSGTSGTANILCDGTTNGIAMITITGHTLSWSSFGDSESKPLLELIADEIAKQYSRPKRLIQMPIQDKGRTLSSINIIGNFQDDLNQIESVNRKFVFNRGSFNMRMRRWVMDLIEVLS